MVAPHKLPEFYEMMAQIQAPYKVYIDNVQTLINRAMPANASMKFDFKNYHDFDTIYKNLDDLANQYPNVVQSIVGGKTYEGRKIKGVKVSFKPNNPGVFIESGIHAREWIAPATAMYIFHQLLTSNNTEVRTLAESPVFNPDGYVYTHTTNRLWRKTRKPYGFRCYGCDPNRNWGYEWNTGGSSNNPCSETYAGPMPFSEIETRSMSTYISSISDKFYVYIALHSYSQLLMFPYGYTADRVDNYDLLYDIGMKTITALAKRYGTDYTVGNIAETIYVASGNSADWIKGTYNKSIVYTYELRDGGQYGFLLPPEQIIPTGEETLDSIIAMLREAKTLKKYGYEFDTMRCYNFHYKSIFIMWKTILCMIMGLVTAEQITFDDYKVIKINVTTNRQVELLNQIAKDPDHFSIWKEPSVNKQAELMVAPQKLSEFYELMAQIQAPYKVSIENVQALINQATTAKASETFDFTKYHTLDTIYNYLDDLEKKYPNIVQTVVAGKSYEGREIKGVKISFKQNNPGVFFESSIHAREWIAPATVLYILDQLLTSNNRYVRNLAESHNWYIFPVCNPDGYVYTYTTNRMWRKTRKPYGDNCYGTDPNRNWGYTWQSASNDSGPCTETYPGPAPFSDIEIKSLSKYIKSICNKFYIYLSFHSYSQLLMFPYSYTVEHVDNYNDLETYNKIIMYKETMWLLLLLDEAYGSSVDWVKFACGTPLLFAYELRDQGEYGFLLPSKEIIPTGEETLDSILAILKEATVLGYP
ncbi:CBPA1 carboxypeptidase, partial [Pseudoatta argentina]